MWSLDCFELAIPCMSLGGASMECMEVLSNLSKQVAVNTNTPYTEVARRLRQRISVDMQRANHRAFARRMGSKATGESTSARRILELESVLEEAPL